MVDVELLAYEEGPDGSIGRKDEEAYQFILKVKKSIERCLEQGMNKAEMFRVIREEGFPTWIAFAGEELRAQNHDFFKEYYTMHDMKKQREKLGRLIQAYRGGGGGSASAGARALEAVTTAAAMETDTTNSMEWSNQQAGQAGCNGELARLLAGPIAGALSGDVPCGAAVRPAGELAMETELEGCVVLPPVQY